jgi:apolipoprotein N-acyltransferase
VPLLVALVNGRARSVAGPGPGIFRPFLLGLVTGVVCFAGTLYWITEVMRTHGGLSLPVSVLVNAALIAYLALYPAVFALIVDRLALRLGPGAALVAPFAWVTTELGRSTLLTGFPWVLLGYSQATVLPIAQLASLLGVYGLSLLVVSVNAALVYAAMTRGRARVAVVGIAAVAVAVTAAWGYRRIAEGSLSRAGVPLEVGLAQGNIPQEEKWDQARAQWIFRTYLDLTREAAARGARFIIWPESSTPFFFEEDPVGNEAIRRLAIETRSFLLVGSDQVERGSPPRYYNAAFLITPEGRTEAVYRKIHLVPFGEYVPLQHLLFFASRLVQAVSDFSAGDSLVMLPVDGHPASTAICYEVVYPDLIRQSVLAGSQLLTTITNDAWYGRSSAAYQHFEQASLRAIEQGRYLARSANTGISGIVDPYGRVTMRSGLFERTALVGRARFLTGRTVYARIGDVAALLSMLLTLAALAATWTTGPRPHPRRRRRR